MDQLLLGGAHRCRLRAVAAWIVVVIVVLIPLTATGGGKAKRTEVRVPELLLDGGRKLTFERSISSDRDVQGKRGFFTKVFDVVVGEPDFHFLVRPYGIVADSRGRVIVSDPGAQGIHIFDIAQHKYKFVERREKSKDAMRAPQCLALDDKDNIYVTDSSAGKVFVFDANGKYERAIGSIKGGEGIFKRPTGIAVDSQQQRIYITDTLRDKIFILDMQGNVLNTIGRNGRGDGEFNYPTELHLDGHNLVVVDAMNFRVQEIEPSGKVQYTIGQLGDDVGQMFRPKGVAIDSEGHLYVVDGAMSMVQVFNREGQLLYYFGQKGTGFGEFRLPAGVFIDREDHVFVVDSYNARVQVFHYYGLSANKGGE